MTYEVTREGGFFFPWAFGVFSEDGSFLYGEKHIESRKAATKDAEWVVDELTRGVTVKELVAFNHSMRQGR